MRTRSFAPAIATLLIAAALPALAQKSWNSPSDGFWNVPTNWTPPGVPASPDGVTLGNIPGTTGTRATLDLNVTGLNSISSLTMLNGNDLDTDDFELVVNGPATLSGATTTLLVKPNNGGALDSFDANSLTVNAGSLLLMLGGRLEIDNGLLDVPGTMTGFGFVDLDSAGAGAKFVLNGGTLNAGNAFDGIGPLFDTAATLQINALDVGATVDLDQLNSTVNLLPSGTLDLNVPLTETFSSTMNLSRKSTLDIAAPWAFNGTMNINTQAGFGIGQGAGPTTITGGDFTLSALAPGGSINLDNDADHVIFDTVFNSTGGTIAHTAGTIQFDANGSVGAGTDFQVGSVTELILNATLTVNDENWNWDGNGLPDNVITINDTGRLNVNLLDPTADDEWSGLMNINAGVLSVQSNNDDWRLLSGTIAVGGTAQSTIQGDRLVMAGGTLRVDSGANLDLNTVAAPPGVSGQLFDAGTVTVDGILDLNGDFAEWAGATVNGSGLIEPGTNTVSANQTISVASYDLDTGITTINSGVTLTLNVDHIDTGPSSLNDQFNNQMINVNSGTLAVTVADGLWQLGNGGILNLNNTGGGVTLAYGSALEVLDGGRINASLTGVLIDTDVTFREGAVLEVQGAGSVSFGSGRALTLDGGDFSQATAGATVTNNSNLTVTGASSINLTTFDWDQGPTVVESNGNLVLSVTDLDASSPPNRYDGSLTINGGAVSVNNAPNLWDMAGVTTFNDGGTLSGDPVRIGNDLAPSGILNVVGSGTSTLSAAATFLSDASVFIGPNATLRTGNTTFEPVNAADNGSFTGSGTWLLTGFNTITERTTINMPGGTVDLDNSSVATVISNDTDVNANLTINVATLAGYGVFRGGSPPIIPPSSSELNIADPAILTVNLDSPTAEWTVNPSGIINYAGNAAANIFLAGSDVNMNGTLNVTGDGIANARMDIAGTVNILTAAERFGLIAGSFADPNTLDGGTINGPGILLIDTGRALSGTGVINSRIEGVLAAELIALGGVLEVNGAILDMGSLRVGPTPAVLDLGMDFDTSVTQGGITLAGGRLQGAPVTLSTTGLSGNGLVLNRVINNSSITARGGNLQLTNADSDWDGFVPETGTLRAQTGNLEVVDTGFFAFNGTIQADASQEVFANGIQFSLQASSTLNLNGGTYRATEGTDIFGTVNVGPGIGTLRIAGPTFFRSGSNTTLTGTLRLSNVNTIVQVGATIGGGGVLLNESTLTLADGATLGAQLDNEGDLIVGASPGQASGTVFTQSASGTWEVEIAGTNPADIDSLALSASAQLDGTLDLSLLGGFTPSLGQTFTILTALSRTGTFGTVIQPPTMPAGLKFDVVYNPTNVQLVVISPFEEWIDSFPALTDPADKTKSANPDGDRLNNLGEFALDGDPTSPFFDGKQSWKVASVGGSDVLTYTFPVRNGATPDPADPPGGPLVLQQTFDGLFYTVQAGDLQSLGGAPIWPLTVTEVHGAEALAIQGGLPPLNSGWIYRTFRSPTDVSSDPFEVMRVVVSE